MAADTFLLFRLRFSGTVQLLGATVFSLLFLRCFRKLLWLFSRPGQTMGECWKKHLRMEIFF